MSTTYTSPTVQDIHTNIVGSTQRHDQVDLDGLDRVVTKAIVNDPGGETYVKTSYDALGRKASVSNPYRGSSGVGDTYTYDTLNRVTKVTHADSSYSQIGYGNGTAQTCSASTYGYGYSTVYTDEVGNQRQTFTDALGRIIEVDEPNSSGTLNVNTCYKYDVLGNLTEVDQGSETRTYTYDMLSRLTSSTTPEGKGSTRYFYYTTSSSTLCSGKPDAPCRRTDERGITTTYSYNNMNQLTGKTYSNSDPSVTYSYNQTSYNGLTIANGKGQRTGMSDASGETAWTYDTMGRVLEEERKIGSITKKLYYTYNLDGSPATVTYPSGRIVTYAPSAVGRAVSAKDVANSVNYVTSASYAPQADLATADYGSSITFSATYDTNRLWPTDLKGATSSTFFELKPGFNYNKTVSGVTNALTSGRTQSFTYDNLNRLITAKSTATSGTYCWGQAVPPYGSDNANGYDRYGNLVKIDSIQCSSPALNLSVNGYNQFTAYTYDAAGNMLTDGSTNSYTWNGEGQLKSTGIVNYTYDGDGNRVEKSSGTYYWFDRAGRPLAETDTSGNTQNEYVYFGGNRTAWRDSSGNVYYYFRDQVGTTRMITNSSGTVCYDADYGPFGYEMAHTTNCSQNYKLAGMELDGETGNYHTLFRGYEPNLARWMSPDPKRGCIKDPQKLNLYPYVRNGPTYRTDPRGDIDEGPCDPFEDPLCNNPYYDTGWCEPWDLLCPWGTPP